MACNVDDVLVAACDSGIGKVTNPIQLWQLIAQSICSQLDPVSSDFRITQASDFRITQAGDSRIIQ